MQYIRLNLVIFLTLASFLSFAQCEYVLDSYSHNNCYGDNSGSINITLTHPSATASWAGPNGFSSISNDISNLYAGTYYLTVTNLNQACESLDSIYIEETIKISADFNLKGRCFNEDSVDVTTILWGGTPPYVSFWENGVSGPNAINLPPDPSSPHILTVTDVNLCSDTIHLWIREIQEVNTFMSSVGVICKDDYSGEARVFIEEATPPFTFHWTSSNNDLFLSQTYDFIDEPFSVINDLLPAVYYVQIIDDMGCVIMDTIEVKSNPKICIKAYAAFSPNDDDVNEFWEIENINLYPNAVVSIYNRHGNEVFRRRNYINAVSEAFGGKDKNGQPLSSGTYYYIIDLQNGDDVFKGTVTIMR